MPKLSRVQRNIITRIQSGARLALDKKSGRYTITELSGKTSRVDQRPVLVMIRVLADRLSHLERQLCELQRLSVGRQVLIERGNTNRGPETGPGFGRQVPAVIEEALVGDWQVRCKLLVDDPDAIGAPCRAGDSGIWSLSQIIID